MARRAGGCLVPEEEEADNEQDDELDPVGSTVRYEMMKLCTGSV